MLLYTRGSENAEWAYTDVLHFFGCQPDTSFHCEVMGTELVHHVHSEP